MNYFPFENTACVEIQGHRVLELVERWPAYAEYEVIGFHGTVIIHDFRPDSLAALDSVLAGDSVDFGESFSTPAYVVITFPEPQQIHIELHPTLDLRGTYTLWIAIGLEEYLPVLDYVFRKIEPFEDGGFAFIALYQQSPSTNNYSSSSLRALSNSIGGQDMTLSSSLWI